MARILIKNGRIWDGKKFFYGDILTEEECITKINEKIDNNADFIFDASGKIVSAGLVDIHVHIKGISSDKFGVQAEMSSFPFGVTAVNDAGGINGDRTTLESSAVKNTVFVCADINNNHADFTITEKQLQKYGDKAKGIKIYFDTSISEVSDITPLKEVCRYAKNKNLKVMVHSSNSPVPMLKIVDTLAAGDILTHAFHGGINSCSDDAFESFKSAKSRGVIIDTGFAGNVHTDFKKFKTAIERGYIPDTISTDITKCSAYKRGGKYGMTMCMSIAKNSGMCEEDIFRAVTVTPSKALGKENEWGYLKEGGCADIAVFDYTDDGFDLTDNAGNHLNSNAGYRCIFTVADGQVIYRY